jgi:beta-xylosidase
MHSLRCCVVVSLSALCLDIEIAAFAVAESPSSRETSVIRADSGDTQTYSNPILTEGYPADPHVILVDGTYYLYATTHGRGFDAWTSKDLVNWKHRGPVWETPQGGAWAPDVFHNVRGDGKFYLYYTDDDPNAPPGPLDKQVGVAVSNSPLGPFEDKKVLTAGSIDGHLFQDDDGRYYFYYVEIVGGFKIFAQPMADPLTPHGERVEVLRPTEPWEMVSGHVTEGPFILKRDGTYYLTYSGTGADSPNYAIGYATSKSPLGPFVKHPGNPIAHRSDESAEPAIYGPGHHCVVTGPDGKMWMVYHQKYSERKGYRRFTALDRMWFDDDGTLRARVTRGTKVRGPGIEKQKDENVSASSR